MGNIDIYNIIQDEEMFCKNIKTKMLKPFKTIDIVSNTYLSIGPLVVKIIEYDNFAAFVYILEKFGIGIKKKNCINLIRMLVSNNSKTIMKNLLIHKKINIEQGNNLAYRLANHYKKYELCECILSSKKNKKNV